jgi:hypothetical protein
VLVREWARANHPIEPQAATGGGQRRSELTFT